MLGMRPPHRHRTGRQEPVRPSRSERSIPSGSSEKREFPSSEHDKCRHRCLDLSQQTMRRPARAGLPEDRMSGQAMRCGLRPADPFGNVYRGHGTRLGRTEGRIDLRLHAPRCERSESGLGASGLDLIAKLVPPFPNVRFSSRHDGILNTSVDHGTPPCQHFHSKSMSNQSTINPGKYGTGTIASSAMVRGLTPPCRQCSAGARLPCTLFRCGYRPCTIGGNRGAA